MINPLFLKDFYKTDHRRQYPEGTEFVYSNFTPRSTRIEGAKHVVVFGLQYLIKEYLIDAFNDNFFNNPSAVDEYKNLIDSCLGEGVITTNHIEELHSLGYLPVEIKSLPEGTRCPIGVPFMTIENTLPNFFWITNFLETLISNIVWGAVTSATTADRYKYILSQYAKETSDNPDFVWFQGHDFSMRGMFGIEAAMISGAAHLLSFYGTDTIPAIPFLSKYYNATGLIGTSVPATEHSVMCAGGELEEIQTFKRLLTDIYPSGIVSIVSDTWDFWGVLTQSLPEIKDMIMKRDGKVVIRPDSGDPVKIIAGDTESEPGTPEHKGAVQVLYELFGGTVNSKGYIELDSHIGLIYGDSITVDRCEDICAKLKKKGFASTNVVLGIGSYTYQHVTRDTYGMAVKATHCVISGQSHPIYKNPKTDKGDKKSAMGYLMVDEDLNLVQNVSKQEACTGLLKCVFKDGDLVRECSLDEIRGRMVENL